MLLLLRSYLIRLGSAEAHISIHSLIVFEMTPVGLSLSGQLLFLLPQSEWKFWISKEGLWLKIIGGGIFDFILFKYYITFLTRWSFDSCLGRNRHSNLPLSAKLAFLTRRIDLILLWAVYLKKLISSINIRCNKLDIS